MRTSIVFIFLFAFSTLNLNAQWVKVTTIPEGGNNYSLAVSGNHIFHGTHFGLFHSLDNGNTWSTISLGASAPIVKTLIIDGNYVYAGFDHGRGFISDDLGVSWQAKNNGLTSLNMHSFTVMGSNVFVGTDAGVFKTENSSNLWTAVNTGITTLKINTLSNHNGYLFAGSDGDGVYISSNAGQSWIVSHNYFSSWFMSHLFAFGSYVYAGSSGCLYRSADNGLTWTPLNLGVAQEVMSSTSYGNYLFVGTYGAGVFYSIDHGISWNAWNDGFLNESIYSLAVNGSNIYAGTCCGYGLWRRQLLSVGVAENSHFEGIDMGPNPTNGKIYLRAYGSDEITDIILLDMTGKQIMQIPQPQSQSGTESVAVDLSPYSKGVYFIKITSLLKSETHKVIYQ
jgi:photosystem II stability/assembly factor-like uncharacterized protein